MAATKAETTNSPLYSNIEAVQHVGLCGRGTPPSVDINIFNLCQKMPLNPKHCIFNKLYTMCRLYIEAILTIRNIQLMAANVIES